MGCGEFYLGENPPHSFLIPFRHILASRVVEERVAALRDDQFETLALSSPPRQKLDDAPQVNHLLDFDHPMKLHELVWIVFPLIQPIIRPARAIKLSSPYPVTTPSVSAPARIRVLMHQIVIPNDRVDPQENHVQVDPHVIFRHGQGRRRNWDSKRLRTMLTQPQPPEPIFQSNIVSARENLIDRTFQAVTFPDSTAVELEGAPDDKSVGSSRVKSLM